MFLFDRNRRLVYHGAIDDSREEDGVSERYARDAIEALLADQDPTGQRDAAGGLLGQVEGVLSSDRHATGRSSASSTS